MPEARLQRTRAAYQGDTKDDFLIPPAMMRALRDSTINYFNPPNRRMSHLFFENDQQRDYHAKNSIRAEDFRMK